MFRIGELLVDRKTGLISSIIVSVFPGLIEFQRVYMIDFALTALTTLTIYFYLKSKDFRELKYSLLFGISFGLSELIKWTSFIYVLPSIFIVFFVNYFSRCPYCYEFVTNGVKHGYRRFCSKKHLKFYEDRRGYNEYLNLGLSFSLATLVAAWWYLPNFKVTLGRLIYFANIGGREGDPSFTTLEGWLYYLNSLLDFIGIPFFILFLFSIYYLHKKQSKNFAVILVSVFIPYVILTILSNKDPRYIIPILPTIAISIGILTRDLIDIGVGKFLLLSIVLLGLLNLSAITIGQPSFDNRLLPKPNYPKKEDWKINDLLEIIHKSGGSGKIVVVLPDHPYLNGQSLEFYRLKNGYSFAIYNGVYVGYEIFTKNYDKIGYIVLVEPREHEGVYAETEKKLYEFFYSHIDEFSKISVLKLPDGSDLIIYKRV